MGNAPYVILWLRRDRLARASMGRVGIDYTKEEFNGRQGQSLLKKGEPGWS